ncbi:MAG: hypothetical protein JWM16_4881 [Verrucomicrobiales bacterium]|nr:hypothetical protein [Verrucomicrobiales bacterium]
MKFFSNILGTAIISFMLFHNNGLSQAGETGTNKPALSFTNTITRTVTISAKDCFKCGAQGKVFVDTNDPSAEAFHPNIITYCERCAFLEIPKLPPCPRLIISALGYPHKPEAIKKRYEILNLFKDKNLADVKLLTVNEQQVAPRTIRIRYDAIPEALRTTGEKLFLEGNGLELGLFESCGQAEQK